MLRKSFLIFHPIGRINHLSERAGWTQNQLNRTWHWSGRTKYWELLVDLCQKLCFSGEIITCEQTFFVGSLTKTYLHHWAHTALGRCNGGNLGAVHWSKQEGWPHLHSESHRCLKHECNYRYEHVILSFKIYGLMKLINCKEYTALHLAHIIMEASFQP